jgi:hypothetical protein
MARAKLLTPVGLRSLSPDHKDYKPKYDGDLRARDAAYHQGTVWAWLIGPFIDAWLKVHPGDFEGAGKFLDGFQPHLREACIGSISEIFDAEPPFTPRGCIAQAWSVAEVLRGAGSSAACAKCGVLSRKYLASAIQNSRSWGTRWRQRAVGNPEPGAQRRAVLIDGRGRNPAPARIGIVRPASSKVGNWP